MNDVSIELFLGLAMVSLLKNVSLSSQLVLLVPVYIERKKIVADFRFVCLFACLPVGWPISLLIYQLPTVMKRQYTHYKHFG